MATSTPCIPCYKDWIACGVDELFIAGILAPNSPYIWTIENKEAKYQGEATTDENGNFTIPVTDLPAAILNPYAGTFTLTVVANDAYQCNSSTWNDSAYCNPYPCIVFEVRNGTSTKNTLGCPCLEFLLEEDNEFIILE